MTILAETHHVGLWETIVIICYLAVLGYLGWLGYHRTRGATDYLIAGRRTHPFVMAMSYGATFISTSAIVGFGGVAGRVGMSLLWLVFLNIFVGIFIAFVFLGGRTRRMSHHLDAHTFPELLGRRFQSRAVQLIGGLIIFFFVPLYAAAVLLGGVHFIAEQLAVDANIALLVFSVIVAAYVIVGGLKGVMYTDALQGTIMFFGMLILLISTYVAVGGVVGGHQSLTDLSGLAEHQMGAGGHAGWTSMPRFGWGDPQYNLWWVVVSTLTLGVGIGVLAQPQLAVRFMTVHSQKELNRAVLVGGLFILMIPGTAYVVGSLSNVYYTQQGDILTGRVVETLDADKGHVVMALLEDDDAEEPTLLLNDGEPVEVPVVLAVWSDGAELPQPGDIAHGRAPALHYVDGQVDTLMPNYITRSMPGWFGMLFLLTLLAAAMSTLSSQFHALGTAISRDVFEQLSPGRAGRPESSVLVVRLGVLVGFVVAVAIGYLAGGDFIARATALFFAICAASFLPAYIGGLYWRRMTRPAALASMSVGFFSSLLWLALVKASEAREIGIVQIITDGKHSILDGHHNWPVVDSIVIALPLSILTAVVVSLLTKPQSEEHLDRCFRKAHP